MSSPLAVELASHRAAVTRHAIAGRLEDYESALLTGTKAEVDATGVAFLMESAGLLVALGDQADEILKFWGLDPATRPQ